MDPEDASFAEIAVALALASSKLRLDITKTKIIAERIGLSKMGYDCIVPGLEYDAALVDQALELFKQLAECEPQVRALLQRKKRRSWFSLAGAAVI